MRPRFRTLLAAGFAVAVAVLALNALVSIRNIRRLAQNNRRALRTDDTLRDLESVLASLLDAESNQRSYLLTGHEDYLNPYEQAAAAVARRLRRLEARLDQPDQRNPLERLKTLANDRLASLKVALELRQREGLESAIRRVQLDQGHRAMIEIRRLVAVMLANERTLLTRRIAESRSHLGWATTTFAVASIVALGTVATLGVVVVRHLNSRHRSESLLRQQLRRWRVTLGSIGDAVIVTDAQERVIFLNPTAEALCGRSRAEADGWPLAEVFRIHDEPSRQPVEDPVARVLREGRIVGPADNIVLLGGDGRDRPIHHVAAPIPDDQGAVDGVVLVFRDDTERRERERELVESNRRKDEFLAMLAHELRNPLAAIRSAIENLTATPTSNGSGHRDAWALGVVVRQVEHLARLLDDLLDVSRITRGLIRVRKEPIDAAAVVERAIETVRRQIDERGHQLDVAIAERPIPMEADPVRLEQILVNLLTNAARYTPPGGHIRLTAGRDGDQVVFQVQDNGNGIPPEDLPRIFDLFAQGERTLARSEGGLGVGLTIVRKLVELHDGTVETRSDGLGRGSTFIVRLPAALPANAPALALVPAPAAQVPAVPDRPTRILIVDDNEDLARGMARLLKLMGHETEVAHDGPEGLEAARASHPDVMLLDIGLPRLDGYSVARALRQEGFRDTLIIAISGYGQDEDRQRAIESGMDYHLTKPVDLKAISALIAGTA